MSDARCVFDMRVLALIKARQFYDISSDEAAVNHVAVVAVVAVIGSTCA